MSRGVLVKNTGKSFFYFGRHFYLLYHLSRPLTLAIFYPVEQASAWTRARPLQKEPAGFCRKPVSKKWQGGHFLRLSRVPRGPYPLHCYATRLWRALPIRPHLLRKEINFGLHYQQNLAEESCGLPYNPVRGNRTLTPFGACSCAACYAPRKWIFIHILLPFAPKIDFRVFFATDCYRLHFLL